MASNEVKSSYDTVQTPRTVKCDACEWPLSKVETHSSGIIICKECGGDSERAPSPASGESALDRCVNIAGIVSTGHNEEFRAVVAAARTVLASLPTKEE